MHGKATGNHNIFYLSKIIYNTYKLWHIRINNLNEVIVFQEIMLSSRCRSTKITAPNMISFFFCFFFLSCWSVQPNNSSSNMIWTIDVALDGLPESEGEFYCWRHQALQIQDSEKSSWVWPDLKTSSLGTGKYWEGLCKPPKWSGGKTINCYTFLCYLQTTTMTNMTRCPKMYTSGT